MSFENSFEEERSLTPTFNTSSHNLLEGEENTKHAIEPKNLLDVCIIHKTHMLNTCVMHNKTCINYMEHV